MTAWLRTYLFLLLVGTVLYGLVGPLFDHHFAERVPYHGHLYLSGSSLSHDHIGASPHTHGSGDQSIDTVLNLPGNEAQQSFDGFAGWYWFMAVLGLALFPVFSRTFIVWEQRRRLVPWTPAPPYRPPILFA